MKRNHPNRSLIALVAVLGATTLSQSALACTLDGKEGFLPPNTMNIPVRREVFDHGGNLQGGGISQAEFNGVISSVEKIYTPIVKSLGGNLVIRRKWTDGTVNADAERNDGNWNVNMYGGLARHKETTIDGFLIVLCHELGHQIGGAPRMGADDWAATEGQADYWATLKCARRVLQREPNLRALPALDAPDAVRIACRKSFAIDNDAAMCIRTSMAGYALSRLLAGAVAENKMPTFLTPDRSVVRQTVTRDALGRGIHPPAQCRLDTYYAGALCGIAFNKDTDVNDPTINTCAQENGATIGFRPRCWYAPGAAGNQDHGIRSSIPASRRVYY